MQKIKHLEQRNEGVATFLAFALLPLSGFATDIYIPSLPSMAAALSVSNLEVQLTLSLFLISYGVSQLFVGTIADSFGRYRISLWGLVIFGIASFIIAGTHNLYLIYLMRIIQGTTTATVIVAKRAFFVDVYSGDKLKHYLSWFTIAWSAGPIIAPFVGGYLQTAFGWESNFYLLGAFALVLAVLEYFFSGETLKVFHPFSLRNIMQVYINMLKTLNFTLGIVMLGLAYAMVMIYNMTGPFIIEHHLKFSPVVAGYSSLILGLAWMVGGFISKATINKPFYSRMMGNLGFQIIAIAAMIGCTHFFSNLFVMVCFAFLIHITAGFVFNNYFTYCLGLFPKNAGTASGLTGGITYVIVSFVCSSILSVLPAKDDATLSLSYLSLSIPLIVVMLIIYRHSRKPQRASN